MRRDLALLEGENLPEDRHPGAMEISLWDKANPRSVINLVPEAVQKRIEEAAFEREELFNLDERELLAALKSSGYQPGPTDHRLRMKFWMEFERAQMDGTPMKMEYVTNSICSREFFYAKYLHVPSKVAWLMCVPTGYLVKSEEALEFGIDQLREILEMPVSVNGRTDSKLAAVKVAIVKMLDDRVKGAVTQKIEQRSLSVTIHGRDRNLIKDIAQGSTEDSLNRRIKDLERKNRELQHLPVETEAVLVGRVEEPISDE